MGRRRHAKKRYFIISLLLFLFILYMEEIGVYKIYPLLKSSWNGSLVDEDILGRDALKLLLISDMHIMCTVPAVEPWLYRWDADRYLKMNIETAVRYVHPDVVIVLGDVFDQGYVASDQEWEEYIECLHDIVRLPVETKLLVTVGDNDIGGEGHDVIKPSLVERYTKEFGTLNDVHIFKNVAFVKVNTAPLLRTIPLDGAERNARKVINDFTSEAKATLNKPSNVNVVVMYGHIPVQEIRDSSLFLSVLETVRPSYYFSGHVHYFAQAAHTKGPSTFEEYVIPTSSYRMGQLYAGLGVATIDAKGKLAFSVLWFPSRFPLLCFSVTLFVVFILFNICHCRR